MYLNSVYLYNRRDKRVTLGWRPKIIKDKDAFVDDDVDNWGGRGGRNRNCGARHGYDNYTVLAPNSFVGSLLCCCLTSTNFLAPPIYELYQLVRIMGHNIMNDNMANINLEKKFSERSTRNWGPTYKHMRELTAYDLIKPQPKTKSECVASILFRAIWPR